MNEHKIALLVDSGTDLPQSYLDQPGVYMAPLTLIYEDGTYRDKLDISSQEVCDRLQWEIPKTSLPSGEAIAELYQKILDDGYTQVIVVTISSGLSGTFSMFQLVAKDFPQLECKFYDSKLIGVGAGMMAIQAKHLIDEGVPFDQLEEKLAQAKAHTHLYFCFATLDFLKKGGRIGRVAGMMGSLLNILPVVSCDEDGIYYPARKARGRKKALQATRDIILEYARPYTKYNLAVAHAGALEEAKQMAASLRELLPHTAEVFFGDIGPALTVHTGPGLIGICLQGLR